jgi:hypothetical protein
LSLTRTLTLIASTTLCSHNLGIGPQKAKNIGEELFATVYAFLESIDVLHLFPYAEAVRF